MTNKEAIKLLSQIRDALLASNSWLPSTDNPIKESFGMAISALAEQRWIPCEERLPEEGQEILATTTDNAWGDVVIIRTYYKEMHKSVIAWMPLPETYREGES